jgi:hypothetical protein
MFAKDSVIHIQILYFIVTVASIVNTYKYSLFDIAFVHEFRCDECRMRACTLSCVAARACIGPLGHSLDMHCTALSTSSHSHLLVPKALPDRECDPLAAAASGNNESGF